MHYLPSSQLVIYTIDIYIDSFVFDLNSNCQIRSCQTTIELTCTFVNCLIEIKNQNSFYMILVYDNKFVLRENNERYTIQFIGYFFYIAPGDRYRVPEFPHSSATFNIISGSRILISPKVLQGALGDSACPTQCSQPCPMPANRHLTGLTWFPIVLYYIK